ncbi:MAG: HIT family protein [Firmicutes bacterium]|nr:HIT family protein [Bacillota bacterium]
MAIQCVFCKIIEGTIPAHRIYEDLDVIAFLDINQTTPGHALVIPKTHYDHFLNTPKILMNQVMNVAQRIGQAQMQMLHAKGVNILSNALQPAGQSVMHFHVHVIPRFGPHDQLKIEMLHNSQKANMDLPMLVNQLKSGLHEK